MYKKIKRIHLIGIGGIGMSGIAELLIHQGYSLSGSDLQRNEIAANLETKGVKIFVGHHERNIEGAELVVFSSAIAKDNPERRRAEHLQIPLISRGDMLAELMRLKYGIAVGGAHGKTTTTSMIAQTLIEAGLDPEVIVGGRLDSLGGFNARNGTGEFMVVEADESDGSFNKLSPSIAVVTNLDREHMDFYKTSYHLKKSFFSFLDKVPFYGLTIYCYDDPSLRVLASKIQKRKKSYGFHQESDYRITSYHCRPDRNQITFQHASESFSFELQVPGKHNALNALATFVVADELSIPREVIARSLKQFSGVRRRFHQRGRLNGVTLIDDYAHHPTEIKATLQATREKFPNGKIKVIFQPHRYSRTEDLLESFSDAFHDCDLLCLTPIYSAGESPIEGITSEVILEMIQKKKSLPCSLTVDPKSTIEAWSRESNPEDVILTLGAGDLPRVYPQLFNQLNN